MMLLDDTEIAASYELTVKQSSANVYNNWISTHFKLTFNCQKGFDIDPKTNL